MTGGWWFPLYAPGAQLTLAVLICLIDGVEAMSMAKRLALVHGYEHNATQDFRGEALLPVVVCGLCCCYCFLLPEARHWLPLVVHLLIAALCNAAPVQPT